VLADSPSDFYHIPMRLVHRAGGERCGTFRMSRRVLYTVPKLFRNRFRTESMMDQRDCVDKIADDLNSLGVLPGHTVMVHSSFKSLGKVPGGIETVIQGFLQAIGEEGTLLMPGFSLSQEPAQGFDVRTTPVDVGAVPEYFRKRPGATRSVHPTHSLCAVGRRVHELLDDHPLDNTPAGPHSPLRKMLESEGKIVMLGCGLRPNTSMHALEQIAEPPYLYGSSQVYTITDYDGNTYQKEYRTFGMGKRGYGQKYGNVLELDTASFLRKGKVLEAETYVMDSPSLKRAVLAKMEEEPYFFVVKMSK